jgi:hypothetical protein
VNYLVTATNAANTISQNILKESYNNKNNTSVDIFSTEGFNNSYGNGSVAFV